MLVKIKPKHTNKDVCFKVNDFANQTKDISKETLCSVTWIAQEAHNLQVPFKSDNSDNIIERGNQRNGLVRNKK